MRLSAVWGFCCLQALHGVPQAVPRDIVCQGMLNACELDLMPWLYNALLCCDQKIHPFSSTKKRMSTVIQFNGKYRLFVKGAPEILLSLCTQQQLANGVAPLSKAQQVC